MVDLDSSFRWNDEVARTVGVTTGAGLYVGPDFTRFYIPSVGDWHAGKAVEFCLFLIAPNIKACQNGGGGGF